MSGNRKTQRFHSSLWSNRQVIGRTVKALERQQAEFSRDHQKDTDEQLLARLLQAAERLMEPFVRAEGLWARGVEG